MYPDNSYPNCGYQNQIHNFGSCPQSAQNPINCGISQLVLLDDCGKVTKVPANDGKVLVGRIAPNNPNGQAEWKLENLPNGSSPTATETLKALNAGVTPAAGLYNINVGATGVSTLTPVTATSALPTGGTAGQVLTNNGANPASWTSPIVHAATIEVQDAFGAVLYYAHATSAM